MNKEFWIKRWDDNHIGFNQASINKNLLKYFESLNLKQTDDVFVPLCGKSVDMLFFSQKNHHVIGVELAEKALDEFFDENNVLCDVKEESGFVKYSANNMDLYGGDFFKINKGQMKNVGLVYDRASLIALPLEMRKKYVIHLSEILPIGCKILLLTVVYDQTQMSGPPHSVSREEVDSLFGEHFSVRLLEGRTVLDENKKFEDRGLTSLEEDIYLIKKIK